MYMLHQEITLQRGLRHASAKRFLYFGILSSGSAKTRARR
jgi:hypothetical protein